MRITRDEIIKHLRSLPHTDDLIKKYIVKNSLPILSFGDFLNAQVLTIGINPSSIEYPKDLTKDRGLKRLSGDSTSTDWEKLSNEKFWSDAEIYEIYEASSSYFDHRELDETKPVNWVRNPYWDEWFRFPEIALSRVGASYKNFVGDTSDSIKKLKASHVDITPWATYPSWSRIPKADQHLVHSQLRQQNKDFLLQQILGDEVQFILVLGTAMDYLLANLGQRYRRIKKPSRERSGAASFDFYPGLVAEGFGVLPPIYHCTQSPSTQIPKSSNPEFDANRKKTFISIYEEFGSRIQEHRRSGEWR